LILPRGCAILNLMLPEKSLAAYKNKPALVTAPDISGGDKIPILTSTGESLKVREKDLVPIHPGPLKSLDNLEIPEDRTGVRDAWELLLGEEKAPGLRELAELIWGAWNPGNAWAAYSLLLEGVYFQGEPRAIRCRSLPEVEALEKKREDRRREAEERETLLAAVKKGQVRPENREALGRFLQDVEALALGKTDRSRTLRDLGRQESPQEAHRLLLSLGLWPRTFNPHPSRCGAALESARIIPSPPPGEERLDLTHLPAFAIDNAWSDDPDDAVSLEEGPGDCRTLWVHVADPAASILPDSPADLEARGRGSTLYLPEGASRMLAPESLPLFALGLEDRSPALSFRVILNPDYSIKETDVFPSLVRVQRLTYGEADQAGAVPAELFHLAEENTERRLNTGAVLIDFPEVHISVKDGEVSIERIPFYKSQEMVRECMVLAGEGAARYALKHRLPFPFVSQEAGELPEKRLPGFAGAYQLRRCMRPRNLSGKPGVHWGLGLDEYSQVTSPLRRYTDLAAHQQIRAFLRGGPLLTEEQVLYRISAAEAAAATMVKAERASRLHWICLYLAGRKDSSWEGILLDKRGNRGVVLIPDLGLETQVILRRDLELNDPVTLSLKGVDIPTTEAVFSA